MADAQTVGTAYVNVELKFTKVNSQIKKLQAQLKKGVVGVSGKGMTGVGADAGKDIMTGMAAAMGTRAGLISGALSGTITGSLNKVISSAMTKVRRNLMAIELRGERKGSRDPANFDDTNFMRSLSNNPLVRMQGTLSSFSKMLKTSGGRATLLNKALLKVVGGINKIVKAGLKLGGIKLALIAIAAVGIGMVAKAWGDLNEEINRTGILFREATAKADVFLRGLSKSFGLSALEVRKLANSIQLMTAISFKGDMEKSFKFTEKLAQRAIDLASIQNVSTEETTRLIGSALQGMTRAARSLGVFMSANETNQKAIAMFNKKNVQSLTEQEKIHARILLFLEKSKFAEGDLMRTSNSIANAWRALTGTIKNIVAGIGKAVDTLFPVGDALLIIKNTLGVISDIVKTIILGIGEWSVIGYIFGTAMDLVNQGLLTIRLGFQKVFELVGFISGAIKGWFREDSVSVGLTQALKQHYLETLAVIENLKEEQRTMNKDNTTAIALLEQNLRATIRQIEAFGSMDDLPNPFEDATDGAKELEKVTSKIGNNITDIAKVAQEAAFKAFTMDLNVPDNFKAGGGGKFRGGSGASGGFDDQADTGINWAEKQAWFLEQILFLAQTGSLFK